MDTQTRTVFDALQAARIAVSRSDYDKAVRYYGYAKQLSKDIEGINGYITGVVRRESAILLELIDAKGELVAGLMALFASVLDSGTSSKASATPSIPAKPSYQP